MAAPTNTVVTTTAVGNREDLEDMVYRLSPEKTPFTNNIGKAKAKATFHEWQTEDLATPDGTNAALEGDDVSSFEKNTRSRVGNRTQIVRKAVVVSETQEAVDTAGVPSELARQKLIKGMEGKRDLEARFIGNYASNEESGATPRRAGGALAWITTNADRGSGGADGGFASGNVTAATNGTQRAFTETLFKNVMKTAFDNGATLSQAYMSSTHKQTFSGFAGLAETRVNSNSKSMTTIIAAADVYVSDFGNVTTIPVQFGLTRDVLLIDPEYWAVGTLRGWSYSDLSKTGDNKKGFTRCEKTLVCKNEKGGAVIADLT